MSEMAKAYNPHEVETTLYDWWEKQGFFTPEQQVQSGLADPNRAASVISMPPPNVTGALHLGHAITSSVEDLLTRYHRMQGEPTLWVPGTDHAGIATQNVVERQLESQGITRHMLGLANARAGARTFRQILSVDAARKGAGPEVIMRAFEALEPELQVAV